MSSTDQEESDPDYFSSGVSQLDVEPSETTVFRAIESSRPVNNKKGFPSIFTEIENEFHKKTSATSPAAAEASAATTPSSAGKPSLASTARKVLMIKNKSKATENSSRRSSSISSTNNRKVDRAHELLKSVRIQSRADLDDDIFSEDIFHHDDDSSLLENISEESSDKDENEEKDEENIPFLKRRSQSKYGSVQSQHSSASKLLPRHVRITGNTMKATCVSLFRKVYTSSLRGCYSLRIAIPLALIALILYYNLGDPRVYALPGPNVASWWLNFIARQVVTFDIARLLEFLLIDCLIVGTRSFKLFGPLVTLIAVSSRGWPFLFLFWGLIDLFLLHGEGTMTNNWLYWTDWEIYTRHDMSVQIINSDIYLRALLCLVLAGASTVAKRFILQMYFGRRQCQMFAAPLQTIIADVVLLNEIATLADHADEIQQEIKRADETAVPVVAKHVAKEDRGDLLNVKWTSIRGMGSSDDDDDDEAVEGSFLGSDSYSTRQGNERMALKSMLVDWQDAETIDHKETKATIEDVLLYKRALGYTEDDFPFGTGFGPASTRDECLASAQMTFNNLCKLSSDEAHLLEFSVLALLAVDENGDHDAIKEDALRRLFRPGRGEKLTMFMFIQSCDSLYRRLSYFRATVENNASLDRVLEDTFNYAYFFVLVLLLFSILKFDPWSLLLSFTSLLVSFSFAIGPTAGRYIHGVLMIAWNRPFDLGDRIFLSKDSNVENLGVPNAVASWLVEDINLSTTKLRFAKTGEIAYVTNYGLSKLRIHNMNRSPTATLVLQLPVHISVLQKDKLDRMEKTVEKYIRARPRRWAGLNSFRCDKIESNAETATISVSVHHRNSWQDFPLIALHRSELLQFLHEVSTALSVQKMARISREVLYLGGTLKDGRVNEGDFSANLLRPSNIENEFPGITISS